jgi:L1 cell adhesion molecule like protein
MSEIKAIGIDLGTTYSCVGVYRNGSVEIIANDQGNRTMPSVVAFTETERIIGDAAKNQSSSNPTNTIFDAKRFIGRKFLDQIVQNDIKTLPFKIVDKNDKPHFQVSHLNETKVISPEEISSMILSKMKSVKSDEYPPFMIVSSLYFGCVDCLLGEWCPTTTNF